MLYHLPTQLGLHRREIGFEPIDPQIKGRAAKQARLFNLIDHRQKLGTKPICDQSRLRFGFILRDRRRAIASCTKFSRNRLILQAKHCCTPRYGWRAKAPDSAIDKIADGAFIL